jgi:hypothetical protein
MQANPSSPKLTIDDWRCCVQEHWADGQGLGSCNWERGLNHLVYTNTGSRAEFVWDSERFDWRRRTNRSSKKKVQGGAPGEAAELDRLRRENARLRELAGISAPPSSPAGRAHEPPPRLLSRSRASEPPPRLLSRPRQPRPPTGGPSPTRGSGVHISTAIAYPDLAASGSRSIAAAALATPSQAEERARRRAGELDHSPCDDEPRSEASSGASGHRGRSHDQGQKRARQPASPSPTVSPSPADSSASGPCSARRPAVLPTSENPQGYSWLAGASGNQGKGSSSSSTEPAPPGPGDRPRFRRRGRESEHVDRRIHQVAT